MSALLISDLHLSPQRPRVTRAFFNFLDDIATNADSLYILGDLFEAWIGDDDLSELALEVQSHLKVLAIKGVNLFFLHGNRDFLIGERFARNTGCTLLPDHYVTELAGIPTVLLHGDTLCLDDQDYQRFRRRYRHPLMLWLIKRLPLTRRQKIADNWRRKSAMANANKPENIMDVSPQAVTQLMAEHQVKLMVHGHTHRPARHQLAEGERIVLGDWHDKGWYIKADEQGIALNSFDISQ